MRPLIFVGLVCIALGADGARSCLRADVSRSTPGRAATQVVGEATYYGSRFSGRETASGLPFNPNALVAAHPTYPIGTVVQVTNLTNGRAVRVRILDRGPTRRHRAKGVVIDLSRKAAQILGFARDGRAPVRLDVIRWGR
jgi:peptidoglycan lytic transglycosylase